MKIQGMMAVAVVLVMATWAPAQQVTVYDNKSAPADSKSAPLPPETPAAPNIAPQMIGDMGFGRQLNPFKIAENESPRPMDRIFYTYNYFSDVETGRRRFLSLDDERDIDIHRHVIGFEKTLFSDRFSLGVRLPFATINESFQDDSQSETDFGDLNFTMKYAFYNDLKTGNLISGGLTVSAPTSTREREDQNQNQDRRDRGDQIYVQPYVGGIFNSGRFYFQGFSSALIPTDDCGKSTLYNDLGVGYFMYQSPTGCIRSVVPTLELHINTPLERGDTRVNATPGVHFQLLDRTWFTAGVAIPVTGPQRFDVEAITQLNFRF